MLLLPKMRPAFVEDDGGGGFWICEAVGARPTHVLSAMVQDMEERLSYSGACCTCDAWWAGVLLSVTGVGRCAECSDQWGGVGDMGMGLL